MELHVRHFQIYGIICGMIHGTQAAAEMLPKRKGRIMKEDAVTDEWYHDLSQPHNRRQEKGFRSCLYYRRATQRMFEAILFKLTLSRRGADRFI